MGIYQSSGHTRNPLGTVSVVVGIVGASASILLWANQFDANGPLLLSITSRLGPGLASPDALMLFATVFGALAVTSAIALSVGGSGRVSSLVAIALGVVALSYPILSWFKVFTRPLLRHALP